MESTWEVKIGFTDAQNPIRLRIPNSDYLKLIGTSAKGVVTMTNYIDYGTENRPPASEQITVYMQHVTFISGAEA